MIGRCTFLLRGLAIAVTALAIWSLPTALRAQDDVKCVCDHYTFAIDPTVDCKVSVCYQLSPKGPTFCQTLGPGDAIKIPCPVFSAGIETCNGYVEIIPGNPLGSRCTQGYPIPGHCCVRACHTRDADGCPEILITPAICLGTPC